MSRLVTFVLGISGRCTEARLLVLDAIGIAGRRNLLDSSTGIGGVVTGAGI